MNDVSDLIAQRVVSGVSPERFTPSPQVRGSMVNGETLLAFQSANNQPLTCNVSLFQVQPLRGGCTETAPAGGAATRRARRCYCGATEAVRQYISGYRSDDERREIARTLNADRRQLTEEQRRAVVVELRQQGHSERAIAGALGVSQMTVHRDIGRAAIESGDSIDVPDRVVRQGGGSYPARRPQVLARDEREQQRAQTALQLAADVVPARTLDLKRAERIAREHQADQRRAELAEIRPGSVQS